MPLLGEVLVMFVADTAGFTTGAGAVVAGLVGVGAAIGESVHMAGDFQNAMLQNVAHAGLAKDQFDNVSASVLKMAGSVGQAPVDLAKALYPIYSGLSEMTNQSTKAQVGLAELNNAAKSVAGTTTDVTVVSRAATSAFNALGLGSNDAGKSIANMNTLFDVMNQTVSQGDMTWSSYTPIVGRLAIAIKGTSTSFVEANAALATMTNQGISARQATTYLSASFTTLDDKSGGVAKRAHALGLNFDETKFKSLSLAQQMDYLKQVTGGNSEELLKLMNNNVGVMRTYKALETGMASYKTNLDAIGHSQGATAAAFATASQGMNASMDRMKAAGQSLMITLGSELLPIVTRVINQIIPLVMQFAAWENKTHTVRDALSALVGGITNVISGGARLVGFFKSNEVAMDALKSVLVAFAVVVAPLVVLALVAMAVAAWGAIVPLLPFIAIIAVVALAIFGLIQLIKHWGEVLHWIGGLFSILGAQMQESATKIKNDVGGIFSALGQQMHDSVTKIKNDVGGIFNAMGNDLRTSATKTKNDVGAQFNDMGTQLHTSSIKVKGDVTNEWQDMGNQLRQGSTKTKNDVGNIFSALGTFMTTKVPEIVNSVVSFFQTLPGRAQGAVSPILGDIGSIFSNLGSTVHARVNDLISGAVSIFSTLPGRAGGAISALPGIIGGILNSVIGIAFSAGSAIVNAVASGIQNSIGAVVQAAQNVASAVANFLPHSPAKEGPLSKLNEFGPKLVEGFASGIDNSHPLIKASMDHLLTPVGGASMGTLSTNNTSGTSTSNGTQTFILQIDGREMARALGPHLTNEIRLVAQVRR